MEVTVTTLIYISEVINPFPTLLAVEQVGSGEAQTEACMALPGRSKWLPVATVTYINYPSRRKPKFQSKTGAAPRGGSGG